MQSKNTVIIGILLLPTLVLSQDFLPELNAYVYSAEKIWTKYYQFCQKFEEINFNSISYDSVEKVFLEDNDIKFFLKKNAVKYFSFEFLPPHDKVYIYKNLKKIENAESPFWTENFGNSLYSKTKNLESDGKKTEYEIWYSLFSASGINGKYKRKRFLEIFVFKNESENLFSGMMKIVILI